MYILCKEPYRILLRLTAMAVLTAFVVNFVFTDAWSLVNDDVSGSYFSTSSQNSGFAVLDADTFSIPSHLGEIVDQFKGAGGRTIVHIQDAHCNLFAQKKISDIIEYLATEYGIKVVNLEGGAGEYDLSPFLSITDSDIRREVSEHFVGTGEISGAELFAVNSPGKVKLWGVEDRGLYLENLEIYRDSLLYKEDVFAILEDLSRALNTFKKSIYSRDLINLDMAYNAYKSGKMALRDYLVELLRSARESSLSIEPYANVYTLSHALEMEKAIDFERANRERNALISELEKKLSKNELKGLVEKTLEFRTKRISSGAFYNYLAQKAGFYGIPIERYPALTTYLDYVNLYDSVNKREVMHEIERLEVDAREQLYTNDMQRQLDKLSRNLTVLNNIFDLRLTKNDYDGYLAEKDLFAARNFTDFISRYASLYGVKWTEPPGLGNFDGYLSRIIRFYEYSFSRDEVFVENMMFSGDISAKISSAREAGQAADAAILMTGGFHTENLCVLLEKRGISYISIMPRFTHESDYVSPYFELLAGSRSTNIERLLNTVIARAFMLALASKLSSLGKDVWGVSEIESFSMAVFIERRLREIKKELGVGSVGLELVYSSGAPMRDDEGRPIVFTMDSDVDENGELIDVLERISPIDVNDLMGVIGREGAITEPLEGVAKVDIFSGTEPLPVTAVTARETMVPPAEETVFARSGFIDRYMSASMGILTALSFLFFTASMWITAGSGAYAIQDAVMISLKTTGLIFGMGILAAIGFRLHQMESEKAKGIGPLLAGSGAVLFILFLPLASRVKTAESQVMTAPFAIRAVVQQDRVDVQAAWEEYWASDEYKDRMAIERYNAADINGLKDAQAVLLDLALGENGANIMEAYRKDPEKWKTDPEYRRRQYRDIWRSVRARFYSAHRTRRGRIDFVSGGYPANAKVTVAAIGRNPAQYSCARRTERVMGKTMRDSSGNYIWQKGSSWYFDKNRPDTSDFKEVELRVEADAREFLREEIPENMENEPYFYHSRGIPMPPTWKKVDPEGIPKTNAVDPAHIFYPMKTFNLVREYGVRAKTPVKETPAAGSWFRGASWMRNAWWAETVISLGVGGLVFMMGGAMLAPFAAMLAFWAPHLFFDNRGAVRSGTVLGLSAATYGAAFLAMANPYGLLAIPGLMLIHRAINLRATGARAPAADLKTRWRVSAAAALVGISTFVGGIFPALSVIVGGVALVTLTGCEEYEGPDDLSPGSTYLEEDQAALIASSLGKSFGRSISESEVLSSIRLSNSESYQSTVANAYERMESTGFWDRGKRFPVLFLEGVKDIGESGLAFPDLSIVVISKATFDNMTSQDGLWLCYILGHEGQHIINKRERPWISRLEDEASANFTMANIAKALVGESSEKYFAASEAFRILAENSDRVSELFGGADFNEIYYKGVAQSPGGDNLVILELYNYVDTGQPSVFVEVNRVSRHFRVMSPDEVQVLRNMMVSLDAASILPLGMPGVYPDAFSYMLASVQKTSGRRINFSQAGSWFKGAAWMRNAWWAETVISLGVGGLVFMMGGAMLAPFAAMLSFWAPHLFFDNRGAARSAAVLGLSAATYGAAFLAMANPFGLLAIPFLMFIHRGINIRALESLRDQEEKAEVAGALNAPGENYRQALAYFESKYPENPHLAVSDLVGIIARAEFGKDAIETASAILKLYVEKYPLESADSLKIILAYPGDDSRPSKLAARILTENTEKGTIVTNELISAARSEPLTMRVFHGTPNEIIGGKLLLQYYGTGEAGMPVGDFRSDNFGARGWGLYVAENTDVAGVYRDGLSKWTIDGIPVEEYAQTLEGDNSSEAKALARLANTIAQFQSMGTGRDGVGTRLDGVLSSPSEASTKKLFDELRAQNRLVNTGRIYAMDLTVRADEIMDMDKPLSGQPFYVREAIENDILLSSLYEGDLSLISAGLYVRLAFRMGSQRLASLYLKSLGIRAVKYLDYGSREAKEEGTGTYNYVVFEDSMLSPVYDIEGKEAEPSREEDIRNEDEIIAELGTELVSRDFEVRYRPKSPTRVANVMVPQFNDILTQINGIIAGYVDTNIIDADVITNAVDGIFERFDREYDEYEEPEETGRITLKILKNEDTGAISIVVSDNGSGIPNDIMEKWKDEFISTKPGMDADGNVFYIGGMNQGISHILYSAASKKYDVSFISKESSRDGPALRFTQAADGSKSRDKIAKYSPGTSLVVTMPAPAPTAAPAEKYSQEDIKKIDGLDAKLAELINAGNAGQTDRSAELGWEIIDMLRNTPEAQQQGSSIHGLYRQFIRRDRDLAVNLDIISKVSGMLQTEEAFGVLDENYNNAVRELMVTAREARKVIASELGRPEPGSGAAEEGIVLAEAKEDEAIAPSEDKGLALPSTSLKAPSVIGSEDMTQLVETMTEPAGVLEPKTSGVSAGITTQAIAVPAGPVIGASLPEVVEGDMSEIVETVRYDEEDMERPIRQMATALVAAEDINSDVANWIITPTNENKETEKAAIFSIIRREYKKSSGYRVDTRINGYAYTAELSDRALEDNLRETFERTLTQMANSIDKTPEKDSRAVAFVPADKYDIAVRALESLEMPNKDRIRIVKEQGIDPTGLVNELHHADIGRELLNYDRIVDRPEAEIDRERAQGVASRIISHIRSVVSDPSSGVLAGDPMTVLNNFLKGVAALPAMDKMDFNAWKEAHETLLAVRRSL
jgi:hypothetical protein